MHADLMSHPHAAPVRRWAGQRVLEDIDARLARVAGGAGAEAVWYPTLLAREVLERAGYPEAFPHLLLSAAAVTDPAPEGEALLSRSNLAAPRWCLSPAVCYHAYAQLAGQALRSPVTLTARGRCYRNEEEAELRPGHRQVEFEMREIVFAGPAEWVEAQAEAARVAVERAARELGLHGRWEVAEDPFFLPSARGRGKATLQRMAETKREYVHGGGAGSDEPAVALASVNRHGTFFGRRFDITGADGQPVHTACVAAGLDRWAARMGGTCLEELP